MGSDFPQSLAPFEEKKKGLLLGAHISFKAPAYFLGSAKEALRIGASAFMIFLGAPSNTLRKPPSAFRMEEGRSLWEGRGYDLASVAVHFPYVVNPASPDEETARSSLNFIEAELERMEAMGLSLMCLHPGSSVDADRMGQAEVLAQRLRPVFSKHPKIRASLETMAGKGRELVVGLNEAAAMVRRIDLPNFGITLDTCHLWDSGEDVADTDGLVRKIGLTVGFEKVFLIHLNDSLNPRNSHRDRHARIGEGMIGEKNLLSLAGRPEFKAVPKILETPEGEDKDSHKREIQEIRSILS